VQQLLQCKGNKFNIFWVHISILSYPAYNTHVPYYRMWPLRLYHIFPHYLINGPIFGQMLRNNFFFRFLWNFCLKLSLPQEEVSEVLSSKYVDIRVKCQLFLWNFNNTGFFPQITKKILKYQNSLKSALWEPSCSVRTGRWTWRS
jgi:hypothetical protein